MTVQIRKPYDARERVAVVFHDEEGNHDGLTEQHHKDMVDIHNIIRQYDRTGLITHVNRSVAQYGDFTEVNEYQESMNLVIRAQDAFSALPADVRKRFGNDPGEFFEFASNPANQEEMVKMGLAHPPEAVNPPKSAENQEPAATTEA